MTQDADGRVLEYDNDRLQRVFADNTEWFTTMTVMTDFRLSSRHLNLANLAIYGGDLSAIEENGTLTRYFYHEGGPNMVRVQVPDTNLASDRSKWVCRCL